MRIGIHHLGEEILVEAAPVDTDADGLAIVDGDFHDGAEVLVVMLAAHIARIDAVLGQRPGAGGVLGEQDVAVVVEVADDRRLHLTDDLGDGARGLFIVDRHAHEFAAGGVQRLDLGHGAGDVGRVRIGHGLDDDGALAADLDAAHVHQDGLPALRATHIGSNIPSEAPSEGPRRSGRREAQRSAMKGVKPRSRSARRVASASARSAKGPTRTRDKGAAAGAFSGAASAPVRTGSFHSWRRAARRLAVSRLEKAPTCTQYDFNAATAVFTGRVNASRDAIAVNTAAVTGSATAPCWGVTLGSALLGAGCSTRVWDVAGSGATAAAGGTALAARGVPSLDAIQMSEASLTLACIRWSRSEKEAVWRMRVNCER